MQIYFYLIDHGKYVYRTDGKCVDSLVLCYEIHAIIINPQYIVYIVISVGVRILHVSSVCH